MQAWLAAGSVIPAQAAIGSAWAGGMQRGASAMTAAADTPVIALFISSSFSDPPKWPQCCRHSRVVQNCCHSVPKAYEFVADCCRLLAGEGVSCPNGRVAVSHQAPPSLVTERTTDALAETAMGKGRDELFWSTASGGYLGPPSLTTSWLAYGVARCQKADPTFPRVTAHALRHTASSLAIHAGANPT